MIDLNKYVESMMAIGCKRITLGLDDKYQPVVAVDQEVSTPAGFARIMHQCVGTSHETAAQEAFEKATHCARMQPPVVAAN